MPAPIRVLFADDHALLHIAIERILGPGFEVLPAVISLRELDAVVASELPFDILLLDLLFGTDSSLGRIRPYLKRRPGLQIIVLTAYESTDVCRQVLKAGAHGFVSKFSSVEHLPKAVSAVLDGERWFHDPILLLRETEGCETGAMGSKTLEVLRLLISGLSYKDIAALLGVTTSTVGHHAGLIRKRMGKHGKRHQDWREMAPDLPERSNAKPSPKATIELP